MAVHGQQAVNTVFAYSGLNELHVGTACHGLKPASISVWTGPETCQFMFTDHSKMPIVVNVSTKVVCLCSSAL